MRILVIDDDPSLREGISDLLRTKLETDPAIMEAGYAWTRVR